MSDDLKCIHVAVPAVPGGYDLVCGCGALAELPRLLGERGLDGRAILCSDQNVAAVYGERLLARLGAAGIDALLWTMPAGESSKTPATVSEAYTWMAQQRVERSDTLVALGGGVVGDVAGFVAATYLRGLRLVQIPTTVVAQVDSALGGKVGVDLPQGKNLVGAFHQPALVVADPDLLATLPEREWRAGMAEVIKHGIIRDPGLIGVLEGQRPAILAREPTVVGGVVEQAAAVKVAVVVEDPMERGPRRILNYGHTAGHAVERAAGFGAVLHGEAVAWGMAVAARIGRALGTCDGAFVTWQDDLLRSYGLLMPLPPLHGDDVVDAIRLDKKSASGHIHWVLPRQAGEAIITPDVPWRLVGETVTWLVHTACA